MKITAPAIEGHWTRNTRHFGRAPSGRYRALRIVEALKQSNGPQTPRQLAELLDIDVGSVMTMASTCQRRNLVRLVFRGHLPLWELA